MLFVSVTIVIVILLFLPKNSEDIKGIEYNEFRKQNGGIKLSLYHNNKSFSTDKKEEDGISTFYIQDTKEAEFRKNKIAYLQSKCIYFDSKGITQETNILRKVINDSTEWFMNTSDGYRAKKIIGFLIQIRNNNFSKETELKLTKESRDSVLQTWRMD